jgi:hypothetical protein
MDRRYVPRRLAEVAGSPFGDLSAARRLRQNADSPSEKRQGAARNIDWAKFGEKKTEKKVAHKQNEFAWLGTSFGGTQYGGAGYR